MKSFIHRSILMKKVFWTRLFFLLSSFNISLPLSLSLSLSLSTLSPALGWHCGTINIINNQQISGSSEWRVKEKRSYPQKKANSIVYIDFKILAYVAVKNIVENFMLQLHIKVSRNLDVFSDNNQELSVLLSSKLYYFIVQ